MRNDTCCGYRLTGLRASRPGHCANRFEGELVQGRIDHHMAKQPIGKTSGIAGPVLSLFSDTVVASSDCRIEVDIIINTVSLMKI